MTGALYLVYMMSLTFGLVYSLVLKISGQEKFSYFYVVTICFYKHMFWKHMFSF